MLVEVRGYREVFVLALCVLEGGGLFVFYRSFGVVIYEFNMYIIVFWRFLLIYFIYCCVFVFLGMG